MKTLSPFPTRLLFFWLGCVGVLFSATDATSQPALTAKPNFWRTDGPVYTLLVTNDTVYLGGDFSYVGPESGGAGLVDLQTGHTRKSFPHVNGTVTSAAPDGQGGWYIGGNFSLIGGIVRSNLAHVLADDSIDPAWNPQPNGTNAVVVVANNAVYVGGTFTRIGGQTRNRLAALDPVTGLPTAWNPNVPSGLVLTMVAASDTIYVGGTFTTVGGQSRNRLAALDMNTGQAKAWNPNVLSGQVNAILVSGSAVYVGGTFTSIGASVRNRIAALDAGTGAALTWNPNANGTVNALAADGNIIYAAGAFGSIGGDQRNRLAAIDATTGLATAWNPNPNNEVKVIFAANGSLYAAGQFTTIGGQTRYLVAGLDGATGNALAWTPHASGLSPAATPTVFLLSRSGNEVIAGGTFTSIGGFLRNNAASLAISTGQATDWNPDASALVTALAASSRGIYVGGSFTNIGGKPRNRLALLLSDTGQATTWNPAVLGRANQSVSVSAIALSDGFAYVGGIFTNVGGLFRTNLAAVSLATGEAVATWNPNPIGGTTPSVQALLLSGDVLYVGGEFTSVRDQPRLRIAAVSTANGAPTAWNPGASNLVTALALKGNALFAGGTFTNIGTRARNRIAAVDTTTGQALTTWNSDAGTPGTTRIYSLAAFGDRLYVGGQFTQLGGAFRNRLAIVGVNSDQASVWNPNMDGIVRAIAVTPDAIYVGGDFTTIGGAADRYFVVLSNRPEFDGVSVRVVNGEIQGSLRTGDGQNVTIQYSTDFQQWQDVSSVASGAPANFTDPNVTQNPQRFYRAVLQAVP